MRDLRFFRRFLPALFVLCAPFHVAAAQPIVAPAVKAAHVPAPLPIAAQLQTLLSGSAPASPLTPLLSPAPASTETAPVENADTNDTEPQETFGTKALNLLIGEVDSLRSESAKTVTNFSAWPQLSSWYNQQVSDAHRAERWNDAGNDLLYVVGLSFLGAMALDFLFLPIRNNLQRRKPAKLSGKLAALGLLFLTRLAPLILFVGVSLTLLDQNEPHKFPRYIALNVVYALTLGRLALAVIRGLFAPRSEALRVVPASTRQAAYAHAWLAAYSLVIIFGYFLVDVARGVRVPEQLVSAFSSLLGLILVVMTLIVIVQKRAFVAALLRGNLSAAQPDLTLFQNLRLWFARQWHVLAMIYIVLGYLVTTLGVENGFALMLRGTILTLLILAIMRVLFHAVDRWGARDSSPGSAVHHAILRALLRLVIWILALVGAAASWGANLEAFFATPLGQRLLGSAFSIGVTVVVVALIYEGCNSAIERSLNKRDVDGKAVQASARLRTLLPMIRNAIFIGFSVVVGMVVLSEAGFNIGPLLAGAGIFGVAVGFGSQTLVKDFLTGLSIVLENTIAIGDVVKIGDHTGVVETMSVRTLRLRDQDGALHILPFSEATVIVNMTKDFAFAFVKVGVAYHSDLDHVMKVIRAVGDEMLSDPIYKRVILEPVEVFGVETLGDSSITVSARMRTRPGKQWDVKRQFLLKIKQRFDKEGIEIPFPTVVNVQKPPINQA